MVGGVTWGGSHGRGTWRATWGSHGVTWGRREGSGGGAGRRPGDARVPQVLRKCWGRGEGFGGVRGEGCSTLTSRCAMGGCCA
eukprot:4108237-Prymnesium_polylepis.1